MFVGRSKDELLTMDVDQKPPGRTERGETSVAAAATLTGTPCASTSVRSASTFRVSFDGLPAMPAFWPRSAAPAFGNVTRARRAATYIAA